MLTNLLPGVRDLRAPLSAGFLWLFGIYLLAWPALDGSGESELERSLLTLKEELSPFGLGVVLAFIAYLLGSVSVSIAREVLSRKGAARFSTASSLLGDDLAAVEAIALDATWEASRRLESRGIPERDAYDTLPFTGWARDRGTERDRIDARWRKEFEGYAEPEELSQAERQNRDRLMREWEGEVRGLIRWSEITPPRKVAFLEGGPWRTGWYHVLVADVLKYVIGHELEQMRTRLLVDQPDLFSKVDRLRAEAEFRAAVAPALLFVAIVLALSGTWWLGVASALLVVPLVSQGRRLQLQSNAAMVEAVRVGKVSSWSLDQVGALGTQSWIDDVWEGLAQRAARSDQQSKPVGKA